VSTFDTYRKLAAGPLHSTATSFRMGAGYLGVWTDRTPRLVTLGLKAWEPGPAADEAVHHFWDELIEAAQCSTDAALQELKRGIDDLEACAQVDQSPGTGTAQPTGKSDKA
jgi:hypothetical protein